MPDRPESVNRYIKKGKCPRYVGVSKKPEGVTGFALHVPHIRGGWTVILHTIHICNYKILSIFSTCDDSIIYDV